MIAHIVYPTIVVDSPLFEVFLDGTELHTEQVSRGTVLWRGHDTRRAPVSVDVVSVEAIDAYCQELSMHFREVAAYIQNPAREVLSALQSGNRSKLLKQARSFIPIPRILDRVMAGP